MALLAAFENFSAFFKCFAFLNKLPNGIAPIKDKVLSKNVKFFPVIFSSPEYASYKPLTVETPGTKSKAIDAILFHQKEKAKGIKAKTKNLIIFF